MKLTKILYNLTIAALIASAVMLVYGSPTGALVSGAVTFTGGLALHMFGDYVKGHAFMALQVELWDSTIEKNLWKNNEFLRLSKKADGYVRQGKYVHIPQQGSAPEVVKNPQNFPLGVSEQEDSEVMYQLDNYATKPRRISWNDTQELSYDFRLSVIENALNKLKEDMAEGMLYNWVTSPLIGSVAATEIPAASILAVTGENGAGNAEAPSATGNRKKYSLTDLQRVQRALRAQERWREGKMNALLTPLALMEIAPADSVVTATYMQSVTEEERRRGIYMKIQGFNIMSRSSVYRTQADGTLRAPGEAGATTDCSACLFWTDEAVETAQGEVKFFERLNDPLFLGDVYNFACRIGGRARRSDYKGMILLRQTATT